MKKGDICVIELTIGAGHEQYGERPAVLISDTKTNMVVVIVCPEYPAALLRG